MELIFAIMIGTLYATGVYMILRRSLVRMILGVVLIGQAANVLIFTAAGLRRAAPPFIHDGDTLPLSAADALPQALILTAIVIGFGVLAFTLILVRTAYTVAGKEDSDSLQDTDRT